VCWRLPGAHVALPRQDGNAGLAEAVLRAYDGARVARLTTVYLTLSLERIAQVARLPGAAEAEVCVLNMVRGKQVSAKIDQRTRSVHFLSADASKELDAELDRLAEFGKQLQDVDKRLAMQKAYVKRLVQRSHQQSDFKEDAGMSVSELAGRGGR
jgi:Skp family chaperone for outer membrane proteins